MLRLSAFLLVCTAAFSSWAADWQVGRIQDVRKDVSSKVLYYVVNTPVSEDVITYNITVHLNNRLVSAFYEQDKVQEAPPPEWTESAPVWVRIEDRTIWLRSATSSEIKLTISKSKPAAAMPPLTLEEIKLLNRGAKLSGANSAVGFGAKEAAKERDAAVQTPPPSPPGGTLDISSVPYLADVFVDGQDMGYSPAKVRVSPGKHAVKVSKTGYRPYVTEVEVAIDSEQKVEVKLEKK